MHRRQICRGILLLLGAEKWTKGAVIRGMESKGGLIKAGVIRAGGSAAAVGEGAIPGVTSMNRKEGVGGSHEQCVGPRWQQGLSAHRAGRHESRNRCLWVCRQAASG